MRTAGVCRLIVLLVACCWASSASTADWPQWRGDACRSGSSDGPLADRLHLQWTRSLGAAMLAWPNEPRLHFDACYEPVSAGGLLLVGSPNDGSLTACDVQTGALVWRYFTEGPVRFAPVVLKDRVYVGSDDGYLHALDLRSGRMVWRLRGAPEDMPERRHLGNNRLISFWPIRGGPVADAEQEAVYFGAGIWPTMGVFVVAADPRSGKLLWRNGDICRIEKVRVDHNEVCPSGLSPQGYLALEGDTLLVPNGRSMPAGLDRRSGKLLYYVQGYRNGDCRVTVSGRFAFVGANGVVDTTTGREVGSRWAAAGSDAPQAFDGAKFHLFEGPIHPYKHFAGCSARSALAGSTAYDLEQGLFAARDLQQVTVSEWESKSGQRVLKPWRWDPKLLWTFSTEESRAKPKTSALIRVGGRLYGHTGKSLLALELADAGQPKLAWRLPVQGTPGSLLAAGGRLFLVTREGTIACYGPDSVSPKMLPTPTPAPAPSSDQGPSLDASVFDRLKAQEGYCVLLGSPSVRSLDDLLQASRVKVIVVDADPARVNGLRARYSASGDYGKRIELFVGRPLEFDLPPYLANVLVVQGHAAAVRPRLAAILESLRPYGGFACLVGPDYAKSAVEQSVRAMSQRFTVEGLPGAVVVRRPGPLAGSAPWTHESADAARTFFSRDSRVKSPLGFLWYGDGPDHGFFKEHDYGTGVKPQVAGGRVVALQIHTSSLHAYDAYTGRLLWRIPVPRFTRYVSTAEALYVAGDDQCRVIDPETGRDRARFAIEGEPGSKSFVSDLRVSDKVIVVAIAPEKVRTIEKGLWDSRMLVALDRRDGRVLWKRTAEERFNLSALAIAGDTVFAIDSRSPIETEKNKRRGTAETAPSTVLAIEARSGAIRWTATAVNPYRTYPQESWLGLEGNDDWLACCESLGLLLVGKLRNARAYRVADGHEVWTRRLGGNQPLILRGSTFLDQGGTVYDTASGKPTGVRFHLARGGCNYAVANEHLVLLRNRSVRCIDATTQTPQDLLAVRSGCSNSLIAADGLLNVPCFAVGCVCNYPVQTSFAMLSTPAEARRP